MGCPLFSAFKDLTPVSLVQAIPNYVQGSDECGHLIHQEGLPTAAQG